MNSDEGNELTPISKSSEILFSIISTFSPKIKLFKGHGTGHIWEMKSIELRIWNIKAIQAKNFK